MIYASIKNILLWLCKKWTGFVIVYLHDSKTIILLAHSLVNSVNISLKGSANKDQAVAEGAPFIVRCLF